MTISFAVLAECGWTLAYCAPNACFARSIASCSISSMTVQPA
jgi:hypothetical protein